MILFHICPRPAWDHAFRHHEYRGDTLTTDGFIHCSTIDQVRGVADAIFRGQPDLVLLAIDPQAIAADVRWEQVDGERFPHVYGPIDVAAVLDVIDFPPSADGSFELPWRAAEHLRDAPTTIAALHERALDAFRGFDRPWWIAGGWALDVWLGSVSRPHEDIDITILRRDVGALRAHLRDWDLRVPNPEVPFVELPFDAPYDDRQHQIWARRRDARTPPGPIEFSADPTWLDLLVEDAPGTEWTFRRDRRITRPLGDYGAVSADGIPYVRPEIQLLYKAKPHAEAERGTTNDEDFERALPHLDLDARAWLRDALTAAAPDHDWLARL